MAVTITITDPHSMDVRALKKYADFLLHLHDPVEDKPEPAIVAATVSDLAKAAGAAEAPPSPPAPPIVVAPLPFPVAAPPAPSSADAAQASIAPEEMTVTSPDPTVAFAQPVPTSPLSDAPVAPPTAPPAPAGSLPITPIEVAKDAQGIPWDHRIHATTKTVTKDGNWKLRRGVDDAEVIRVTAELKGVMALPGVAAAPVAPPPPPAPVAPPPPPAPPAPPAPPVAPPPPAPPAPPAPPVAPPPPPADVPAAPQAPFAPPPPAGAKATGGLNFTSLLSAITKRYVDKSLQPSQVQAVLTEIGVAQFPLLASRPDLVGIVAAKLGIEA